MKKLVSHLQKARKNVYLKKNVYIRIKTAFYAMLFDKLRLFSEKRY